MSNLRARESLERAQRLFLERPSTARRANSVATATWKDGLRCDIAGPAGETASTDMPEPMGGAGHGPNPGWLMRASMASCAATAIAMRAAMLGIELKALEVEVTSESDARGLVGIDGVSTSLNDMRMTVKLAAADVPEPRLRELAEWGSMHSPIGCTLRDSPNVALSISIA